MWCAVIFIPLPGNVDIACTNNFSEVTFSYFSIPDNLGKNTNETINLNIPPIKNIGMYCEKNIVDNIGMDAKSIFSNNIINPAPAKLPKNVKVPTIRLKYDFDVTLFSGWVTSNIKLKEDNINPDIVNPA